MKVSTSQTQSSNCHRQMTIELIIPNMACGACGETITTAVKKIDPTATVQADPKTKQVKIETQASQVAVESAITAAGYQVAY